MGCALFIVGAVLQAAAYSVAQMTVGRLGVGLGVGSAALIVPLYIAEVAPARYRGRMIGLDNMSVYRVSQMSNLQSDMIWLQVHHWRSTRLLRHWRSSRQGEPRMESYGCNWRGSGNRPDLPPSSLPRITAPAGLHGNYDEAERVIARIFPNGTPLQVQQKVQHITQHVNEAKRAVEGKSTFWLLKQLYVVPSNLRALIAACGLMAISQLGGFNSLMYYSFTLLGIVGFSNPVAVGTIIAGTNSYSPGSTSCLWTESDVGESFSAPCGRWHSSSASPPSVSTGS